jgi:quinol monooxygenase YgiN
VSELQVIARYTVSPENRNRVLTLLPRVAEASRTEPGNRGFEIYDNVADPTDIVLLERYASREAFAAHRDTTHFHDLVLGQIVPLLDTRTIEQYEVTD